MPIVGSVFTVLPGYVPAAMVLYHPELFTVQTAGFQLDRQCQAPLSNKQLCHLPGHSRHRLVV